MTIFFAKTLCRNCENIYHLRAELSIATFANFPGDIFFENSRIGCSVMIFLDYKLEPSEVNRLTELDIISAGHTALDYYLFCGDIYFQVNGASFDAPWGWIPVISFSMHLCDILCSLGDGERGRLEFTESDDEIHFIRTKDVIDVSCDYSDAHAQVSLSDMRVVSIRFAHRIIDELSDRWPLLKTNNAFQEKVDRLFILSEKCR